VGSRTEKRNDWINNASSKELLRVEGNLRREILGAKKQTMSKSLALDVYSEIQRELTLREDE
jgi:hypothetical protein